MKKIPKNIPSDIIQKAIKQRLLKEHQIDAEKLDIEDIALQQIELQNEIYKLKKTVKFENNALIMTLPDGSSGSIVFTDKRGNRNMLDLFKVIFELWKKFNMVTKDNWKVIIVSKAQIREGLKKVGKKDVTDRWIKDTMSNIRQSKIKGSALKPYVILGYFLRKYKGWAFAIKS